MCSARNSCVIAVIKYIYGYIYDVFSAKIQIAPRSGALTVQQCSVLFTVEINFSRLDVCHISELRERESYEMCIRLDLGQRESSIFVLR